MITSIVPVRAGQRMVAFRPGPGVQAFRPPGAASAEATVRLPLSSRPDPLGDPKERLRVSHSHLHECMYPSGLILDVVV